MFSWQQICIWLLIAGIIGCAGELMAGRHSLRGFFEAGEAALLAVLLIVGIFHFHFAGELIVLNVPLLSTVFIAALFASIWSGRVYHHP